MNRKLCVVLGALLLAAGGALYAQDTVSLNQALKAGAKEIENKLDKGTTMAVLTIPDFERLSRYVQEEMLYILTNGNKITLADRDATNQTLVRDEIDYGQGEEVSENSAQALGTALGASYLLVPSIEDMGTYYRLRFRTLKVQGRIYAVVSAYNVPKDDPDMVRLMGIAPPSPSPQPGQGSGSGGSSTAQRQSGGGGAFGYAALNILVGLGSYLQGDLVGGLVVTGGYAAAAGLIVWEVAGLKYEDDLAGVPGTIGLGVAGAAVVFGFIKPFLFQGNSRTAAALDKLRLTPVAAGGRFSGFGLTFTHSF